MSLRPKCENCGINLNAEGFCPDNCDGWLTEEPEEEKDEKENKDGNES